MGKSTVINKVLAKASLTVGGFRSGFDHQRSQPDRWLYMWDASHPPAQDEAHRIVHFTENKPQVFTERIDVIGAAALRRAHENGAQLILMDECGRFEGKAERFKEEIFASLDGDTPVLGVVRQGYGGWLDDIRNHSKVTVLTVTEENRDTLHEQILPLLKK